METNHRSKGKSREWRLHNHRSKGKSREWRLTIAPKTKAGNRDQPSLPRQKQGMETYHRSQGKSREWRLTIAPKAKEGNRDGPSLRCNRTRLNIYLTPQVPIVRKPEKNPLRSEQQIFESKLMLRRASWIRNSYFYTEMYTGIKCRYLKLNKSLIWMEQKKRRLRK